MHTKGSDGRHWSVYGPQPYIAPSLPLVHVFRCKLPWASGSNLRNSRIVQLKRCHTLEIMEKGVLEIIYLVIFYVN